MAPLSDLYARRRVAARDARACAICHRPSTVVLVNEVQGADHFYTCEIHLTDPAFAKPVKPSTQTSRSQAAAPNSTGQPQPEANKTAIEDEIARLKREWEQVKEQSGATRQPATQPQAPPPPPKASISTPASKEEAGDNGHKAEKGSAAGAAAGAAVRAVVPPATATWFHLDPGVLALRIAAKRRLATAQRTRAALTAPGALPPSPRHIPE